MSKKKPGEHFSLYVTKDQKIELQLLGRYHKKSFSQIAKDMIVDGIRLWNSRMKRAKK